MRTYFVVVLGALLCLPMSFFAQTAATYELAGLEVEGCERTKGMVVRQLSGLQLGDKIQVPGPQIAQAIKRLLGHRLFAEVAIEQAELKTDLVWLKIRVREAPVLKKITVSGLNKRRTTEWTAWLNAQAPLESAWLPAHQTQLEAAVRNHLEEQGYRSDCFALSALQTLDGAAIQLELAFARLEKLKLTELHWRGVTQTKPRLLEKAMGQTLLRKASFTKTGRAQAHAAILAHYRDLGYVDAAIVQDTSWQVGKKWHWELTIAEGAPYTIGAIEWKGARKYDPAFLQSLLGIDAGDPYRPDYLERRLHFDPEQKDISGLYMDDGHLFFRAEAVVTSLDGQTVNLEIRIEEGAVAIIESVNIVGNERTNEHVLRRELRTQPGEPFSRAEVLRSQRALVNLGYFNPETLNIATDVDPQTGKVDLTYEVEEKRNDKFELSAGINPGSENGVGVVGTLGFNFNNFSLREMLAGNWRSAHGDGQQLSIRAQSSGLGFQSYNLSFAEPWFRGQPRSLGFSVFHQRFAQQDSLEQWNTLAVTGANLRLGQRLPWGNGGWTLNSELGYQHIRLDNLLSIDLDSGTELSTGKFHNLYAQLKLAYRNINDPFFPRSGSNFELSGQWTPPWQRTLDQEGQEQFDRLAYHKYRVKAEKFLPVGKKLVVRAAAKMGGLLNYGADRSTPPFERFELGGNGLSGSQQAAFVGNDLLSLRGYEQNDIPGSTGGGGAAFAKFTAELRYPLFNSGAARGYILGFAEAGNSWKSVRDFNPFDLYRSAGIGVRFQLPMFGTIGFDYGLGFDRQGFNAKDWKQYGTFNLILGMEPE